MVMPRVRITMDGTASGTHVFDENGDEVKAIRKIEIHQSAGAPPIAYIELIRYAAIEASSTFAGALDTRHTGELKNEVRNF